MSESEFDCGGEGARCSTSRLSLVSKRKEPSGALLRRLKWTVVPFPQWFRFHGVPVVPHQSYAQLTSRRAAAQHTHTHTVERAALLHDCQSAVRTQTSVMTIAPSPPAVSPPSPPPASLDGGLNNNRQPNQVTASERRAARLRYAICKPNRVAQLSERGHAQQAGY